MNIQEKEFIGDGRKYVKQRKEHPRKHLDTDESPTSAVSTENITQEDTIEKAVRYLEKLKIGYDVKHAEDIKDSCTQTSKTILQLAKLEKGGTISPDSLSPSPRGEPVVKEYEIKSHYTKGYPAEPNLDHRLNQMSFSRKNDVINYVNHYQIEGRDVEDDSITFPRCSLIETYLSSKSNSRRSQESDHFEKYSVASEELLKSGHSRFLEQTSPFKKLVKSSYLNEKDNGFKSQSYIDPPYTESERRDPQPISRFTVKRVRQQNTEVKILKHPPKAAPDVDHHLKNKEDLKLPPLGKNNPKFPSPRLLYQSRRANSFMSPTIASEQKSKQHEVCTIKRLISPTKRGRSVSPKSNGVMQNPKYQKIPYIDQSYSDGQETNSNSYIKKDELKKYQGAVNSPASVTPEIGFKENLMKLDLGNKYSEDSMYDGSQVMETNSSSSTDNVLFSILHRIRNTDWNVALKGLAEITDLCKNMDRDILYPHMITVNQRLLELLRSPRSHVCRTACQAAGHLFESMKDTRRPEFDDIVDILLFKTADANKFIRQDANLALDCMVTHIPIYHAIRALCVKGPTHKNHLVRTATVRLMICAVVIAGPSNVLNPNTGDITRKRIVVNMTKFVADKNIETRKYGERLYHILSKEPYFDIYLKKYLEKEEVCEFKKSLKCLVRKH